MHTDTGGRRRVTAVVAGVAMAAAGLASTLPAAADPSATDQVIFEEDFSAGELPDGFDAVLGDWQVLDGRLVSTSGEEAARLGFGPQAPENFRLEVTAEFVEVENAARWLSLGVDYHADEHWGAWVGLGAADDVKLARITPCHPPYRSGESFPHAAAPQPAVRPRSPQESPRDSPSFTFPGIWYFVPDRRLMSGAGPLRHFGDYCV